MRKVISLIFRISIWYLYFFVSFSALAQSADSISVKPVAESSLKLKTFIVPAILSGYGIATFYHNDNFYDRFDAKKDLNRNFPDFRTDADKFLQYAPGTTVYALNFCGIKGKNNFVDRTAIFIMATALNAGITYSIKSLSHVQRPDIAGDASMPSGHTATAFVNAQFMHREYGEQSLWYSSAAYADATAVAVIRMLNDKHWLSDVLVGAAVGMVSVQITYWIYPKIKKQLVKHRKLIILR